MVSVKEISPIKREIDVVVPADEVGCEFDAVYAGIGQKAKLKGFRPGKAPRSVLEQYYREDAESEVVRNLVSKSYSKAIEESGLQPVAQPEINITSFGPNQNLTYLASFEVRPTFELKGHMGLELIKEKTEVVESEVDQNLTTLQERMAKIIPVSVARKAKDNDVIAIDYQAFQGEVPIAGFEGKDYLTELGKAALLPELESGIPGMQPGGKKKIDVTLPPNWPDHSQIKLAGEKVTVEVYLKEIREKQLPELNDEFAKDLGDFTSLEEVKARIREDLARGKEQASRNSIRHQVIEKLIQQNDFQVPEAMVQMELEDMLHRLENNLKQQGMTFEQAGVTREDFFSKNREAALFRAKGMLLFEAVAEKEKITVTIEEVDRRIEEMARLAGQPEATIKKYYHEKNLLPQIAGGILDEKILDFALAQSKIRERE